MTTVNDKQTIHAGEYKELQFTVTASTGSAVDLTMATEIVFDMREADWKDAVLEKKLSSGGIAVDSATVCRVILLEADTAPLAGTWQYHLYQRDALGEPDMMAEGVLEIERSPLET